MKSKELKIIQVTDGFEVVEITTTKKTLTIVPTIGDAKAIVNFLNKNSNEI